MTDASSTELLRSAGEYDLACRCANKRCRTPVQLEREEHEILRSDPRLFVVSPGHERGCHGDVLIRADRYVVVRTRERRELRLVGIAREALPGPADQGSRQ